MASKSRPGSWERSVTASRIIRPWGARWVLQWRIADRGLSRRGRALMHVIRVNFGVGMVCSGEGLRRSSSWVTSPQSQFTRIRWSLFFSFLFLPSLSSSVFPFVSSSSFSLATSSIAFVASTAVTLPCGPTAFAHASAISPVPVHKSRTWSPAKGGEEERIAEAWRGCHDES